MKTLITTLLIASAACGFSQLKEAKFQQFNNFSATFEVPAGKTWEIQQVFSNYSDGVVTNADGTTENVPVLIYIKTLNGDIKTDYEGKRFGPLVYHSDNNKATMSYPIVLPENTKFSLVILSGEPENCKMFNGTGYMSWFEVKNDKK